MTSPVEGEPALTLDEVADQLGVHYMTAYRYVRTGRLVAQRKGSRWLVTKAEVGRFTGQGGPGRADIGPPDASAVDRLGLRSAQEQRSDRFFGRLVAGDSAGCWALVEDALIAGSPVDVYLEVVAPALRRVGEGWVAGTVSIVEEHQATALALRIIGRLSPLFSRPGRRRKGTVVLAGVSHDTHLIPVAMVADVLRGAGFVVVDLGADVPRRSLLQALSGVADLLAVGVSVSVDRHTRTVAATTAAVRRAHPGVVVLVGGPAVENEAKAKSLGADYWTPDAFAAAELLVELNDSSAKPSARAQGPARSR